MLRLVRLQIAETAALLASCAADDLVQQLEGTLGRPRVTIAKAEIGIDDSHKIELGKVVSLGHELCADDEIEATGCNILKFLPQAIDRLHEVAGKHQHAGLRKELGGLLFE